jgi:hypothetical protein
LLQREADSTAANARRDSPARIAKRCPNCRSAFFISNYEIDCSAESL